MSTQTWQRMQSQKELLLRVDENDKIIGSVGKVEAHRAPGIRHRAFTIFLFNDVGETLLTQRSAKKPLWPLWWDGACSSHPWPDEILEAAGKRRLPFELGIEVDSLEWKFSYTYRHEYDANWVEHEWNHILIGKYNGEIKPNPDEVASYKWESPEGVSGKLKEPDAKFAPWFQEAWKRLV